MKLIELARYISLAGFVLWAIGERVFSLLGQQQITGRKLSANTYWYINFSWYGAMLFTFLDIWYLGWTEFSSMLALRGGGVLFIVVGLAARWHARAALGRQYSVQVQTSDAHELVTSGLFRVIRHPAYLGLLCLLIGIPLAAGSYGGLAIAVIAGVPSINYRIQVEENAMREWFGARYEEYCRGTWRLVPYLW